MVLVTYLNRVRRLRVGAGSSKGALLRFPVIALPIALASMSAEEGRGDRNTQRKGGDFK